MRKGGKDENNRIIVSVPTRGLLIPNLSILQVMMMNVVVSVPTRGLLIPNQLLKNDNAVDTKRFPSPQGVS